MFLYSTIAIAAAAELEQIQKENEAFENMCNSLSESDANRIRLARHEREKEERNHQKKLEIAREGRSLNFWGNR